MDGGEARRAPAIKRGGAAVRSTSCPAGTSTGGRLPSARAAADQQPTFVDRTALATPRGRHTIAARHRDMPADRNSMRPRRPPRSGPSAGRTYAVRRDQPVDLTQGKTRAGPRNARVGRLTRMHHGQGRAAARAACAICRHRAGNCRPTRHPRPCYRPVRYPTNRPGSAGIRFRGGARAAASRTTRAAAPRGRGRTRPSATATAARSGSTGSGGPRGGSASGGCAGPRRTGSAAR